MSAKTLKQIAVTPDNYLWLKSQGRAGDSFNDVITHLREKKESRTGKVEGQTQPATPTQPRGDAST